LHWPRTGVKGQLDVGETAVVCVLTKIHPELVSTDGVLEVDKLNIELGWKLNETRMKQIANQVVKSGSGTTNKVANAVRFDEKVNTVQEKEENFGGGDYGDFGGVNAFEKNCGACTMLNPTEATKCDCCGTAFD